MTKPPLSDVATILTDALDPLYDAMTSTDGLVILLEDLGWRIDLASVLETLFNDDANDAFDDFRALVGNVADAISGARDLVETLRTGADLPLQDILDLISDFRAIISQIQGLVGTPAGNLLPDFNIDLDPVWQSLTEELPEYLLTRYLSVSQPKMYETLLVLGIVEESTMQPPAPSASGTGSVAPLRVAYLRRDVRWDYLGDLLRDPVSHLAETYRWNNAAKPDDIASGFNAIRFLTNQQRALTIFGLNGSLEPLSPRSVERFYGPDPVPPGDRMPQLSLPIVRARAGGAFGHFALQVAPVPHAPDTAIENILLTHETIGGFAQTLQFGDGIFLTLGGSVDASQQLNLLLKPAGPEVILGNSTSFDVSLGLTAAPPGGFTILGGEGGTRIGVGSIGMNFGFGGTPAGVADLATSVNVTGFTVAIAAGEGDGLLNKILGNASLEAVMDLTLGYNLNEGVFMDGSGGFTAMIPIDQTIGPLTLDAAEISFGPGDEGVRFEGLMSASFSLGPLFAAVERIGLSLDLEPAANGAGMIGPMDLGVGFVPPSGYALALDADPITRGGYVSISETEYRGALALSFKNFGFSAFAILNTELPNGEEGFSFAGSIFAEFSVPLAFGFFLTGVGGFIGINRTINTDAMRDVLFAGRLDDLMFPADPIESASQILDDMAAIMPPQEGQHIIGPVVRIGWGQPTLVNITMGVLLEFGQDVRVVILGGLSMILPDEDKVLVSLKLQFMGEIDFTAGTISFDATLEGSRVLTFAIDGDVAIRTGWGPNIKQVASFGGLHPDYPKPDNLPDLARLSISFGGNNPKLTLSAYQAVTYNSLQVGARADMYAKGPKVPLVGQVAASGYIAFDALIYFNPFSFQVSLRGGLAILVDGKEKAALHFSLELRGPNTWYINGQVWVKVMGVKVKFGVEHRWGQRETVETFTASAVSLLREALERTEGFQPVEGNTIDPGATYRQLEEDDRAIDPLGGLRFTQNAVPLGVRIKTIGEADVSGPDTVDIKVFNGSTELAMTPSEAEFVRGHFFSINESQRLSDPVFEHHKAGFAFSDTAMVSGSATVTDTYDYEIVEIPMHDSDSPRSPMKTNLSPETFTRVTRGAVHRNLRPLGAQKATMVAKTPVGMRRAGFVTEDAFSNLQGKLGAGDSLADNMGQIDSVADNLSAQRIATDQATTPVAGYIIL